MTFCSDSHMMHLIRLLVFFAAKHIFGSQQRKFLGRRMYTVVADALSRNNMSLFRLYVGSTSRLPPCAVISSSGVTNNSEYNLDIHKLDEVVQRLYRAGLSAASHKTYQVAQHCYLAFCMEFSLASLPTFENILCYFIACLGQQGLTYSSLQT